MKINKSLRILFLINAVFVFASSLLGPLYAIYVQGIDRNIISVSFSWAVFMFSSTIFMYFVSKYGDYIKEKEYLLAAGFLVRCLAWFGYIFVSNLSGLIALQIILGLGEALGTPSWDAIFAKHLDKNKEIMDYSDWNIVRNLMIAIATVVGGVLVTYFGFNLLFTLMGLLAFISFIGVLITPKKVL